MVEPARRHGPFDFRYAARRRIAGSPPRPRHDLEALAAFEADRGTLDSGAVTAALSEDALRTRNAQFAFPSRAKPILARSGTGITGQSAPGLPALTDWEWEGGSVGRD
jgi:hypothetical protein